MSRGFYFIFFSLLFSGLPLISQVSSTYKDSVNVDIDQYWSKGIEYLATDRFDEAQFLLSTLSYDEKNTSTCALLSVHFQKLKQALQAKNKQISEEALADFVISGILIDITSISTLSTVVERKIFIKKLLRELVAIQTIAKKYRFQEYKEILISLRNLHIAAASTINIVELIKQNDLITQTRAAC
jgi:hypothetical protein